MSYRTNVETAELHCVCLLTRFVFGPKKITLEELSESKSFVEEKSADRSHSVNSIQTASHETTNVAVYEVRPVTHYLCQGRRSFFCWLVRKIMGKPPQILKFSGIGQEKDDEVPNSGGTLIFQRLKSMGFDHKAAYLVVLLT